MSLNRGNFNKSSLASKQNSINATPIKKYGGLNMEGSDSLNISTDEKQIR